MSRSRPAIVANSAGSIAGVEVLELTLSNPPTATEVQSIVGKINELIGVLSRT